MNRSIIQHTCLSRILARATALGNTQRALELIAYSDRKLLDIPFQHGIYLCNKALVLRLANQVTESVDALQEAKSIAQELNAGSDSIINLKIKETEELFARTSDAENPKQATWAVSEQKDIELTKIELSEGNIQQLKIQADMLVEQGDLDETQSLYEEALTAYNDALEIYSKIQDARGII